MVFDCGPCGLDACRHFSEMQISSLGMDSRPYQEHHVPLPISGKHIRNAFNISTARSKVLMVITMQ